MAMSVFRYHSRPSMPVGEKETDTMGTAVLPRGSCSLPSQLFNDQNYRTTTRLGFYCCMHQS